MSPRAWQEHVEDILNCARNVQDFTKGMSFESFLDDPRTIRAVAYEFTTIGEATAQSRKRFRSSFPMSPGEECREFAMSWCMNTFE